MKTKDKKTMERIFLAKKERRIELAKLPIEEKIKILVQLQKIASVVLLTRGLKRQPWRVS